MPANLERNLVCLPVHRHGRFVVAVTVAVVHREIQTIDIEDARASTHPITVVGFHQGRLNRPVHRFAVGQHGVDSAGDAVNVVGPIPPSRVASGLSESLHRIIGQRVAIRIGGLNVFSQEVENTCVLCALVLESEFAAQLCAVFLVAVVL